MGSFIVPNQKAFTLVEVLISIFILVTVLSTVFASYTGTFQIIDETESQAKAYQMARTALERISQDLESAYTYLPEDGADDSAFGGSDEPVEGDALTFVGEPDRLQFPTRAHVSFGDDPQTGQIAVITYETQEQTGETGGGRYSLNRRDVLLNDIIQGKTRGDQPESSPSYPVCKDLTGFENANGVRFVYFDADEEENDSWESSSEDGAFPTSVGIELYFANPLGGQTPLKFTFRTALQTTAVPKKDAF